MNNSTSGNLEGDKVEESGLREEYVWMEFGIDGEPIGSVVIRLFPEVRRAVENFKGLITGDNDKGYCYINTAVSKISRQYVIQMGDVTDTSGKGTADGGDSIFGGEFADEPEGIKIKVDRRGRIGYATMDTGKNTNKSQFIIATRESSYLSKRIVVFGEVAEGFEIIEEIEDLYTDFDDVPIKNVRILDCGLGERPCTFVDSSLEELKSSEKFVPFPWDIDDPSDQIIPLEERHRISDRIREVGNLLYKAEYYQNALLKYGKSLRYLMADSASELQVIERARIPVLLNRAAVNLRVKSYSEVVRDCDEVLRIDPSNLKAAIRKMKAHLAENDFRNLVDDARLVKNLGPDDPESIRIRRQYLQKLKSERD